MNKKILILEEIPRKGGNTDLLADEFASPVYFYSWTSQIKTVIDRTFAIEPILTDTKFYLLSAGAAPKLKYMENMTKSFELYLSCFRAGGVENVGVLYEVVSYAILINHSTVSGE